MTVGVLQDIIIKVRELAALGTTNQATQAKIIKYINSYYAYDFPDDLRILKLKDMYTFNTIKGVDTYPFDFDKWSSVQAPAYCGKVQISLFQDVASFYAYQSNQQQLQKLADGDGTAGPYSGTTQGTPILASVNNNPITQTLTQNTGVFPAGYPPSSTRDPNISRIQNVLISADSATTTLHVTDDGAGNLIGDCAAGGTINYTTGAIANLVFTSAIPADNQINIQYIPVNLNKPFQILFFQNQFVLRPVPDQAYTIEITAYREPSQALMGTDSLTEPSLDGRPEQFDWWELIAFGVAKKFYQDRLDMDGVQMMEMFLQEKISEARTRTYAQLGQRQINTLFKDETNQLNSTWGGVWN